MFSKKIFIGFVALMLMSTACDDGFLTQNPPAQISSSTFWQSEDDLTMGLAGCYNWLVTGGDGFGALSMPWATLSDNAWARSASNFNTIASGQIESTSGGIVSAAYSNYYQAIATCNNFIENAPSVDIAEEDLNQYLAEARFIRAYYYFRLVRLYGGVPLLEESLSYQDIQEADIQRSSAEQVVQAIHEDLDFAIQHLPDEQYVSHAVKGSALGLKTRVYLYQQNYGDAATTAKQIIDSQTFELADSYQGLFLKPSQNNNPEIMFSARYQFPNLYSSLDYHIGWDQWEHVQPIQDLIDAYECKDGLTVENSPICNSANPYENRDPRLRMTNYVEGDPWVYGENGTFQPDQDGNNQTGYLPKKYLDTSRAPYNYETRSNQDWVILRYADVLLMYAEAQNEVSGPDQSVYDAVNAVRNRVDMPDLPQNLSKSEMRQRIRNERRVELALEGQRYFDLKRWGIAEEVLSSIVDPGGDNRVFTEKHYLWPIPQSEIDKTGLEQNPGY